MVVVCRDYLTEKLKDAGVKTRPITSMKRLKASQDSRVAAVLFDGETFEWDGAKKRFSGEDGTRHKRRKVFSREATFSVIIGDPLPEKAEELFEAFLRQLDSGIYIGGNYTSIEVGEAEWAEEEDSILKSKVAVNVKIKFIGGVYKDTGLVRVTDVEVTGVRKDS